MSGGVPRERGEGVGPLSGDRWRTDCCATFCLLCSLFLLFNYTHAPTLPSSFPSSFPSSLNQYFLPSPPPSLPSLPSLLSPPSCPLPPVPSLLSPPSHVMAHDAATVYLSASRLIKTSVYNWTKTQSGPAGSSSGTVSDLLTCGARSLDWRPRWSDGRLVAHHGDVEVAHLFSSSLSEIASWCGANPSELVMVHIWDCTSDDDTVDCNAEVDRALSDLPKVDDCDVLKGVTVGEAKALALLPGGGHLLPIFVNGGLCTADNYVDSLSCWGTRSLEGFEGFEGGRSYETHGEKNPKHLDHLKSLQSLQSLQSLFTYSCWSGTSHSDIPWTRMYSYLDAVMSAGPSGTSLPLYQAQAIWQETVESIAVGELHLSSLLEDEVESGFNLAVAASVREGRWRHVNQIEVNNVCDGGGELKEALDEVNERHGMADGEEERKGGREEGEGKVM